MMDKTTFWIGYDKREYGYVFTSYFFESKFGLTKMEFINPKNGLGFEFYKKFHKNMNYRHKKIVERGIEDSLIKLKVMKIID